MNPNEFFGELKRRNVYKVAVAYAVVGWLLIQVATQVFPFLEIPNWAIRLVIFVTALGFPVAVIIAWAFELTPEGVKRTEVADAAQQRSRGGVWIAVVVVAATLSLGLFFLGRYTARNATARQSETASASNLQKSIAVLPLVNTSGDPSNEYFSDGLSEELIAVLAKIPELKVIGRSSSFFFKGKSDDAAAIGQKLGVANLIEGSVRKQGDRVRIVAELISAADGRSLWSETYDRELKDVFAVQAEIAKSVAEQMKVKLLGETVRSDAVPSSQNPAAHNAVLHSDFYFQQQTAESVRRAITFLEEAVRLDPNYALAYAKLAQAWRQYAASFSTEATDDTAKAYGEARRAADKAVSLAPDMVETRMTVGLQAMNPDLDFRTAEQEFRRVLQSAPSDAAAKNALSMALLAQGRLAEAERSCREAISLDPLLTTAWYNTGRVVVGLGRYKEAEELFRKGLEIQPHAARFHSYLAMLDILQNRPAQAMAKAQLESEGFWRDYAVNLAQQAQNDRPTADAALKDFIAKYSNTGPFQIAVLYAVRKEPDEMFKSARHRLCHARFRSHPAGSDPFLPPLPVRPTFHRIVPEA
ncbi:MAG TPA: tetratricopeptide repeat protein [Candidatus Udaeobacter sp.]|jgi:serine/threonine-protein kinase